MALTFNGTSQYGRIATNTTFNITSSVTLMGWCRTNLTSTQMQLQMQRLAGRYLSGATANEQYGLDIYMGWPRFMVGTTTVVTEVTAAAMITSNTWTHICGTYDGASMRMYVNGELSGTTARSGTITSSTGMFSFGADYNGISAVEFFNGSLEDIRLYNRALSQAEIETIVTCRGTAVVRNGLILSLQLDEQRIGATLAANALIYDTGPLKMNATNVVAGTTFSQGYLRRRRFA